MAMEFTSMTATGAGVESSCVAAERRSPFGLRAAQYFLLLAMTAIAISACVSSRRTDPPLESTQSVDLRIDMNSATWRELSLMPCIGEVMARRIIADRKSRGPFGSVSEMQRIAGIGPRTMAEIETFGFVTDGRVAARIDPRSDSSPDVKIAQADSASGSSQRP